LKFNQSEERKLISELVNLIDQNPISISISSPIRAVLVYNRCSKP